MNKTKCKTKDCKRNTDGALYCSIECACYDGAFNIRTGWNKEKIKAMEKLCKGMDNYKRTTSLWS